MHFLSLVRYFEIAVHMKWYLRREERTTDDAGEAGREAYCILQRWTDSQAAVSRLAGSRNLGVGLYSRPPPPAFPNFRAWFRRPT